MRLTEDENGTTTVVGYLVYDDEREEWVIEAGDWEPPQEMVAPRGRDGGVYVEVKLRRYGFQP